MEKETLKSRIDDIKKESHVLSAICDKYPDVFIYKGRWREYYSSKTVNPLCVDVYFAHACGCCDDATLYVEPYVKEGDIEVYSCPARVEIGMKRPGGGYYINFGWTDLLKKYGFKDCILEKVQKYFDENPIPIESDDEEYGDEEYGD